MSLPTMLAGAGTGLSAGVYLAFSTMVMPALARTSSAPALGVMQRINDLAVRPVFMTVFFAATVGSAWVLLAAWLPGGTGDVRPTIGAAGSLAAFGITLGFHVPRNRRIAGLDPDSAADLAAWTVLSRQWSRGNHVRACCAGLGFVGFLA